MKLNTDEVLQMKRALAALEHQLDWRVKSTQDRIGAAFDDVEEAQAQEQWLAECVRELETVRSLVNRLAQPNAVVAILL